MLPISLAYDTASASRDDNESNSMMMMMVMVMIMMMSTHHDKYDDEYVQYDYSKVPHDGNNDVNLLYQIKSHILSTHLHSTAPISLSSSLSLSPLT